MHPKRITFAIQAENRADVLARIALLFHRLNVEIHTLSMVRKRGWKTMQMRVVVEAEMGHAHRLKAHLSKVVQVRSVIMEQVRTELRQEVLV
jgi:acetolactate synthase small subunit